MYKDQLPEPKSRYQFYNFSCHRYSYNTCLYIFPELFYFVFISKAWSEERVLPSVTHGIQVPMNALHSPDECPHTQSNDGSSALASLANGASRTKLTQFSGRTPLQIIFDLLTDGLRRPGLQHFGARRRKSFCHRILSALEGSRWFFRALRSDSLPSSRALSP